MADRPAAVVAERYARGTAAAAVLIAVAWHLANDLPATSSGLASFGPGGAPVLAGAWIAYAAVAGFAGVRIFRGRPGRVFAGAAVAVLMVGTAAVTAAAPPALRFGVENWPWGAFGWFALLALWRRPLRYLLAALALNGALMLAVTALAQPVGPLDVARWGTVVYGTGVLQLVLAYGARQLEELATRLAEAATIADEAATGRSVAEALRADRRTRYQDVGRTAGTLLAGIAAATVDPRAPEVQRRAAIEAARLRRLLAERDEVSDPLRHELRAAADIAARHGVAIDLVTVGVLPDLPPTTRRTLIEGPLHVLAAARTAARITVAGERDAVHLAVVADVPDDLAVPESDGVEVTVECHWEGKNLCLRSAWRLR